MSQETPAQFWARRAEVAPLARPRSVVVRDPVGALGRRLLDAIASRGHRCCGVFGEAPDLARIEDWAGGERLVLVSPPLVPADGPTPDAEELDARIAMLERALTELCCDRLVLISSLEAAGAVESPEPVRFEGSADEVHHDTRARALLRVEERLLAHRDRHGRELVILRPGALYSDDDPGLVEQLLRAMTGDPPGWLSAHLDALLLQPLHHDDLAQAVALAIDRGDWIYHLSDHSPRSVGDLARRLAPAAEAAGLGLVPPDPAAASEAGAAPAAVHRPYPDHRARRELAYEPCCTFAEAAGPIVAAFAARLREEREGTPEAAVDWNEVLESEWEKRARSPHRDFFVSSHADWDDEETWARRGRGDAEFILADRDEDAAARPHVLEIGCGVGRLVPHLMPRVASYTGTDIAPGMVEEARRRNAGAADARFFVSGADRIPDAVRDRGYDLVFALAVFIHCPRPVIESLAKEAHALLAPGGLLRFQVLAHPDDPLAAGEIIDAESGVSHQDEVSRALGRADLDGFEEGRHYRGEVFRRAELQALAASLGTAYRILRFDSEHYYVEVRAAGSQESRAQATG